MNSQFNAWMAGAASVASNYHQRDGVECQDAAVAGRSPRPFCAVFDGRGSSALSQHGSQAAAEALPRIVETIEPLLRHILDDPMPADALWRNAGELILRLLREEQRRVARERSYSVADLEFTVSLAILGTRHVGVVQLGDSATVIARADGSAQLAALRHRGEMASETVFLSDYDSSIAVADYALLPATDAVAVLAFSDGVAAGWTDEASGAIAPGVSRVVERLRTREWGDAELVCHLNQCVWHRLQDDDRSVGYVVIENSRHAATEPPCPTAG